LISIEHLFANLPAKPMTDSELDVALQRIGQVETYDRARLAALRTAAVSNRLVERDAAGRWVKAAQIPTWPTDAEVLEQRQQREHDDFFTDRADYTNPARAELEAFVQALVGDRLDALEARLLALEEQLETRSDLAAF
jgi:hypothetical protein